VRILLIEENPHGGRSLNDQLCRAGHVVQLAPAGPVAADLLKAVDQVDVMIFDLGSADKHGFDLIRDVRHGGTDVPVIILSAADSTEDRVRGLDAGADAYLAKPFVPGELEARLRALARRMARAANR
jgi:two-component system, OmpR family, response regulator QseB